MMSKGKRILEVLTNENPDAIVYEDMDDALIGIYRGDLARQDMQDNSIAVYSYVKVIETYIKRDGMSEEVAVEFYDFNVAGGYIGEYQPIIVDDTGV